MLFQRISTVMSAKFVVQNSEIHIKIIIWKHQKLLCYWSRDNFVFCQQTYKILFFTIFPLKGYFREGMFLVSIGMSMCINISRDNWCKKNPVSLIFDWYIGEAIGINYIVFVFEKYGFFFPCHNTFLYKFLWLKNFILHWTENRACEKFI